MAGATFKLIFKLENTASPPGDKEEKEKKKSLSVGYNIYQNLQKKRDTPMSHYM